MKHQREQRQGSSHTSYKRRDEKPWLKAYPSGARQKLSPPKFDHISDALQACFEKFGDRTAFYQHGQAISYRQLSTSSTQLAGWLQSLNSGPMQDSTPSDEIEDKSDKGPKLVAVCLPNIIQAPIVLSAIFKAGMSVALISSADTSENIVAQLADCGAQILVTTDNVAQNLHKLTDRSQVKHLCFLIDDDVTGLTGSSVNLLRRRIKKRLDGLLNIPTIAFRNAIKIGAKAGFEELANRPKDLAILRYGMEDNGQALATMLSHRSLLANADQIHNWFDACLKTPSPPLNIIWSDPLSNLTPITLNMLGAMQMGATCLIARTDQIVHDNNRAEIAKLVKDMTAHPIHIFTGDETFFTRLLRDEAFRSLEFGALQATVSLGHKVSDLTANRWRNLCGKRVHQTYGHVAMAPVISMAPLNDLEFKHNASLPLASTLVDIRDANNQSVDAGEMGEICVRGPQMMSGYFNNRTKTLFAKTEDGLFKTGDLGMMDEKGALSFIEQIAHLIKIGDHTIIPHRIEHVVRMIRRVDDCRVVRELDKSNQAYLKLYVCANDRRLKADTIHKYCCENLHDYEVPDEIEFCSQLPAID